MEDYQTSTLAHRLVIKLLRDLLLERGLVTPGDWDQGIAELVSDLEAAVNQDERFADIAMHVTSFAAELPSENDPSPRPWLRLVRGHKE